MPNYVDNMYNWLKRQGYAAQFEHAGIYKISIDDIIVYIGKSDNMLWRLAQHYVALRLKKNENKYKVLNEAKCRGHSVSFDVLRYARCARKSDIIEEIGSAEGEYIRKYRPPLNTQIPKEFNWRKYDYNAAATTVTLDEILAARNQ